jgi:predicted transcriptional regulator of viral defense system
MREKTEKTDYGQTGGLEILGELVDSGRPIFTSEEAQGAGKVRHLDPARTNVLLALMADAGLIRRLKRGLYAVTGKLPGIRAPHDFAIATAMFTPSAISHASALNFHGLSEQAPQAVTCMTTKKIMTPTMRSKRRSPGDAPRTWVVDDLRIIFFSVSPARFIGIEQVWVDSDNRVPITDKERTVLEMFLSPRAFGGMAEAVSVLDEHRKDLDLEKLARYAVEVKVAVTAKRLGWALEAGGATRSILNRLRAVPAKGVQRLDPARPAQGPVIREWMLQDNFTKARSGSSSSS